MLRVGYLFADGPRHGHGERPDVASAQVLPLALVAEELELPLLLVIQTVAVAHLARHTHTSTVNLSVSIITSRSTLSGQTLNWFAAEEDKCPGNHSCVHI